MKGEIAGLRKQLGDQSNILIDQINKCKPAKNRLGASKKIQQWPKKKASEHHSESKGRGEPE